MSFRRPFTVSIALALAALASAQPPTKPDKTIVLFDGHDLAGWTFVTPKGQPIEAACHVTPDGLLAIAGKPTGYLLAQGTYADYRFHAEWRWTSANPKSNAGFFVHVASGPIDRKTWPLCLQIQNKVGRAGDLIPMAGFTFAELPPGAKQTDRQHPASENPMGDWNRCDIVCQGGTVKCAINGVWQNIATHCSPQAGGVALQLEGYPYEVRNVRIDPL